MPTLAIPISAGARDGHVRAQGSTYPPSPVEANSSLENVQVARQRFSGPTSYTIYAGLLRFDTSVIPADAVISSAVLRIYVTQGQNDEGRSLQLEWYDPGSTIDLGDWSADSTGSANGGVTLSSLGVGVAGGSHDIALSNLGNIAIGGWTGLRAHISGGAPAAAANNYIGWAAYEDGVSPAAQLIVTYTSAGGGTATAGTPTIPAYDEPVGYTLPTTPAYKLYIRDADNARVAELPDDYELEVKLRLNDASTWTLSMPRTCDAAKPILDDIVNKQMHHGIILVADGETVMSGPIYGDLVEDAPDGDRLEVSGVDDTGRLASRLALSVPSGPPYTSAESDPPPAGTIEDQLRYYVYINAADGARVERRIPGLVLGGQSGIGRPVSIGGASAPVAVSTGRGIGRRKAITEDKPKGTASGDVLLAHLVVEGQDTAVTPPQGWTLVTSVSFGVLRPSRADVWTKIAGDAEPASYTFTLDHSAHVDMGILDYVGPFDPNPIEASNTAAYTSTASPTAPQVTTAGPNRMVLALFASDKGEAGKVAPPDTWAERYDFGFGLEAADYIPASAGTSAADTFTSNRPDNWGAITLALKPSLHTESTVETTSQEKGARFENLLERLQELVKGLTKPPRFRVVQSDKVAGRLLFLVEPTRDLTGDVIFSRVMDNLSSGSKERAAPSANYVIVGGEGEGTQRTFSERGDSESILRYGRFEAFADARSSEGGTAVSTAIDKALTDGAASFEFKVNPLDRPTALFRRSYDLGDIVSVVVGDQAEAALVTEVGLKIDGAGGAVATPVLQDLESLGASKGFSTVTLSRRLSNIERTAEGFTAGMGVTWWRPAAEIPSGWQWADGTSGLPDTRRRFILGADPSNASGRGAVALGATGGGLGHAHSGDFHSHNHQHGTVGHDHGGTNNAGGHGHGNTGNNLTGTSTVQPGTGTATTKQDAPHAHGPAANVNDHSHTIPGQSPDTTFDATGPSFTSQTGIASDDFPPWIGAFHIHRTAA